jgi:hypothetical protein
VTQQRPSPFLGTSSYCTHHHSTPHVSTKQQRRSGGSDDGEPAAAGAHRRHDRRRGSGTGRSGPRRRKRHRPSLAHLLAPPLVSAPVLLACIACYTYNAWPVRDLSLLSGGGIAWLLRPPRRSAGASPVRLIPSRTSSAHQPNKLLSFSFVRVARSDGMALGSGSVDLLCCTATATHPPEWSLLSHAARSHNAQPQICARGIITSPY